MHQYPLKCGCESRSRCTTVTLADVSNIGMGLGTPIFTLLWSSCVQLPAFPRDLKRRSRTSPWCRIVRRCPGCTDSSKEPSVQPSFGRRSRVPKYPICHICRYHGAHWSHPGWLGPTLHTCDSHRVSNSLIFLEGNGCRSPLSRCSGWPWWLPSMPLRRDSLWPSKLPPSGRMGRTGTGSAGRRSVVSCQPGLNQQPGKNGQKMWRGHNLQPVIRQGRWFQKHLGLLPTFPPQGFGASESNQSMTQYQEQVPRWQRGALLRFYLAFLAHQKKAWEGFLLFSSQICAGMITQSQVTGVLDPHWHQRKACW